MAKKENDAVQSNTKQGQNDSETDYLTLEFDDGVEVECEIMGVFDCDGEEYIALLPEDGTDDVYIYGYKEFGDDDFELVDIEDDEKFERVVAEFDKVVADDVEYLDLPPGDGPEEVHHARHEAVGEDGFENAHIETNTEFMKEESEKTGQSYADFEKN